MISRSHTILVDLVPIQRQTTGGHSLCCVRSEVAMLAKGRQFRLIETGTGDHRCSACVSSVSVLDSSARMHV